MAASRAKLPDWQWIRERSLWVLARDLLGGRTCSWMADAHSRWSVDDSTLSCRINSGRGVARRVPDAVPENSLLRQRGAVSAPTDFSAPTQLPGKLRCGM